MLAFVSNDPDLIVLGGTQLPLEDTLFGLHQHALPDGPAEVLGTAQWALDPGCRDLQGVRTGLEPLEIESTRHFPRQP